MTDRLIVHGESRPDFHALIERSPDIILCFNRELRCIYANPAFEQRTGIPPALILGRLIDEWMLSDPVSHFDEHRLRLERIMATGQADVFRLVRHTPQGTRAFDMQLIPEVAADGTVRQIFAVARDITQQWYTEQSLRASEARYQAMIEAMPDGMMRIHRDGTYLECKPIKVPEYPNTTTAALIGRKVQELLPPEIANPILEQHQRALATGELQTLETLLPLAGETRYGESRVVPLGPDEVLVVLQDITERKRAEAELRRAAEFDAFRALLADALRPLSDPIAIQHVAMRLLGEHLQVERVLYMEVAADEETLFIADHYVNGAPKFVGQVRARDFAQLSAKLRTGQMVILADVANDATLAEADRAALLALGIRACIGIPLIKEGRWVANLGMQHPQPRTWSANDIAFLAETAERTWADVERARAETALRVSEEKYRRLFAAMDEGYLLCEVLFDEQECMVDLLYLEANPAASRMLGGDYTGRRFSELYPNAECELYQFESWGQVARTGQSERMELYIGPTGAWLDLYVFKPERENAASRRVAVVFQEITQRKAAEEALRRSEELVRQQLAEIESIYAAAPVGLCVYDKELRYLRINETLAAINGVPVADHLGRTPRTVLPPQFSNLFEPLLRQVLATGEAVPNFEVNSTLPSDPTTMRTFLDSYYPLKNDTGEVVGINVVVAEITHLKAAERHLQRSNALLEQQVQIRTAELLAANRALHSRIIEHERSEERYRHLVEMMPDAFFLYQQNRIIYGNPAFLRLVGATAPEQVLGKSPLDFVHPDSRNLIEARIRQLLDKGGINPPIDIKYVRLDGIAVDVESAASVYQEQEENAIQVIARDVTLRKAAEAQRDHLLAEMAAQRHELQLLNHRLATIQENESKRLARELHDQVGQNLTALSLSLSLLQERFARHLPNAAELLPGFDDAQALVAQINTTVREMLSELQPPMLADFGLLASLRWYADGLARRLHLPIQVSGEEPMPPLAEPIALALFRITQEALTNVVKHAQASQAEVNLWADADAVHLLIEDNGRGFDPAQLTDPTQHPHWGLLHMRERAAAVGGEVTIESQPQQGTVVHVEVPR